MPDAAAPPPSAPPPAAAPPAAAGAAAAPGWTGDRAWHAGWALAQAGLAAAALLAAGDGALRLAAGLAVAALPGALGAAWGRGRDRTAALVATWTAAMALAAALAGGAASPLGADLVLPAVAALALEGGAGRPARAAVLAAVAAAAAALGALLLAAALPPAAPLGAGAQAGLGWGCAVAAAVAAAFAWSGALTGAWAGAWSGSRTGRDAAGPPAAAPAAAPDARVASAESARDAALRERDDAREAAAARTRFLAHMSHELRTPLNAVIGFSDIMRTRLFGPLPERYGEYAGLIHESGEHLLAVINDVLDLAKTEAGRYELRRELFDAREALAAALRLTRVQADESGVDLRAAPAAAPVPVDADPRALKQMALNLISNALKFTGRGGYVTAGVAAVDGALELTVADTGVGIAPEDLERLGRPFEQAEAARGRPGTGLGLSLVRAFARLHGGEMRIESRLGAGTAVTVRLPVLAAAPAREAPLPDPAETETAPGAR